MSTTATTVIDYINKRRHKDSYIGDLCQDLYDDLGEIKLKAMNWEGLQATIINKKFLYPAIKEAADYILRDIRSKKLVNRL